MALNEGERVPPVRAETRERASLLAALRRIAAEQGYRALTIEAVTRAAGLPRERFDAHFENQEEALLAAQAEFLDRLREQVARSCQAESSVWHERLRAALHTLLTYLAETEDLARALLVEVPAESFRAAQQQFEALDRFAALLREARRDHPVPGSLPEITERFLVGGVESILAEFLLGEQAAALPDLEPQLVELLLIPYLGPDEARRVAGVRG